MTEKTKKSEAEWKLALSELEYYVLREKGTERPHTGKFNLHFEDGTYVCKGCKTKLFNSNSKFDAHCGWPSFDEAIPERIIYQKDDSLSRTRTEILCSTCNSHLGHVFDDGPTKTGLRYCVNSIALDFINKKK